MRFHRVEIAAAFFSAKVNNRKNGIFNLCFFKTFRRFCIRRKKHADPSLGPSINDSHSA